MCQCSFSSSYKPRAGGNGLLLRSCGGASLSSISQNIMSAGHAFYLSDTSSDLRDIDEAEGGEAGDRYGATISAIKTNCLWWWMYIPPVTSHQAKVRR